MSCSGVVKFFNAEKGFGFITTEQNGDIFVHRNQCQGGEPQEGDEVNFEMQTDERNGKLCAAGVTGGTAPLGSYGGGGKGGKGKGGKGKGGGGSYGGGSYGDRSYGGGGSYGERSYGGEGSYGGERSYGGGKGGGGMPVCRQFQSGNCSFGDRCRFSHE